ncbi:hypothetical protein [Roseateles cavernae]|uniref:hypothetical protein n=1 Tax=Roseateles cavernae TaxID=3153578 RepID=UPI0032E41653
MKAVQRAWERLSNAMRLYSEAAMRFSSLVQVDREEAINNLDLAFEAKLETFHTLYDVSKGLPGFKYFDHGDTSLLIVLRNAIHHWDHDLFESMNARLGLEGALPKLAGAEFLMASYANVDDAWSSERYVLLDDFYTRLANPNVKNATHLQALWESELRFAEISAYAKARRYPVSQVYINLMPIFISAMHRVCKWLETSAMKPKGFDGNVYSEHFLGPMGVDLGRVAYKTLRV